MSIFKMRQKVLFQHCDPAGIVFYPRYFEMINAVVEEWFSAALGVPFEVLHGEMNAGVPTAHIDISFHAPSRHGDMLDFELEPVRVGSASVDITIQAYCHAERRLSMKSTLVYIDKSTVKPKPWPTEIRDGLTN